LPSPPTARSIAAGSRSASSTWIASCSEAKVSIWWFFSVSKLRSKASQASTIARRRPAEHQLQRVLRGRRPAQRVVALQLDQGLVGAAHGVLGLRRAASSWATLPAQSCITHAEQLGEVAGVARVDHLRLDPAPSAKRRMEFGVSCATRAGRRPPDRRWGRRRPARRHGGA
jgi:hypothetical protein